MKLFTKPKTMPRMLAGDLPFLPVFHTLEELAAWKLAVAALPDKVIVPPRPKDDDPKDPIAVAAADAYRRAVLVAQEQEMQAQTEHANTDPVEVATRDRLASMEIATLDDMIEKFQNRRADLEARRAVLLDRLAEIRASRGQEG